MTKRRHSNNGERLREDWAERIRWQRELAGVLPGTGFATVEAGAAGRAAGTGFYSQDGRKILR